MAGVAANAPSPEGWQQAKPLIEQLYVQQDRPLKEVRAYLAEYRNFLATERMFKQRLKEWGFDRKKVKAVEWRYMLRVTRQRRNEGKDTAFRVNGKVIVWSNIRKHLKRKKKTEDEFLSAGPETEAVEDVLCYTPPGSPRLSMSMALVQTASPQALVKTTYPLRNSAHSEAEKWHASFAEEAYSPESEPNGLQSATSSSYLSPSSSADTSSVSDLELQSMALRPIIVKSLPPLDEAAALKIAQMLAGSHTQPNPNPTLSLTSNDDQAHARSEAGESWSQEPSDTVQCLSTGRPLSDEDIASRWVAYYFQACFCESQGDTNGTQENVQHATTVFRSMLRRFNPYLLTGLTLMTSMLYYHERRGILINFLKDSCEIIYDVFPKQKHPVFVHYRYMSDSVCGDQPRRSTICAELDEAYRTFLGAWGEFHPNTLTALYYYGCSLLDDERFEEAKDSLVKCLSLSEKNLGYSHLLTIWALATLSRTLSTSNMAEEDKAIDFLNDAINRCRIVMHEEHPYFLELNRLLAVIHEKMGHLQEVEMLYRLVLIGRIKMLGINKEFTEASRDDLNRILRAQGKMQEATQLLTDFQAMTDCDEDEGQSGHGVSC
jgi:tetratricopeptide (TPR) repeat protein